MPHNILYIDEHRKKNKCSDEQIQTDIMFSGLNLNQIHSLQIGIEILLENNAIHEHNTMINCIINKLKAYIIR